MTFLPRKKGHVRASNTPRIGEAQPNAYYDKKPVWRLANMHMTGPEDCGWDLMDEAKLKDVHSKLAEFEALTWKEILVSQRHRHHRIGVSSLQASAKKVLADTPFKHHEEVVSLRLSGPNRVFGVLENEIFNVLWWDPDHKVCPAPKKHT